MLTEQKLKDKCTPEFIKWMCEYAEGFELVDSNDKKYKQILFGNKNHYIYHSSVFPLLIHRAVEGINSNKYAQWISQSGHALWYEENRKKTFMPEWRNYQPEVLTQCECAMLHCLQEIFSKQI